MIANEVVFRAAHRHAGFEQTEFELPEPLLAAPVGMSNERAHHDPAGDGCSQFFLEQVEVESKDDDVYRYAWHVEPR